jgi:precorrin-6B methylase 2
MGDLVRCLMCGYKYYQSQRCPRCGAVYPLKHTEEFHFYSQLYSDQYLVIKYIQRVRIYETIINKILRLEKDTKFLDIGASVGVSLILFQQYGKAMGVELNIPELRQWHRFLGIEHALIYINEDDNIEEFYETLSEKVNGIDFVFLIDTLRCIPLPTLIDELVKCLKENGALVIKEVNPDNRKIMEARISRKHGDAILYSPKTIMYLARKNKLDVNWYLIVSSIDNLAIPVPYSLLRILKPSAYVAVLRRKIQHDCCHSST